MKKFIIASLVLGALIAGGYAIWVATTPQAEPSPAGRGKGAPLAVKTATVSVQAVPVQLDAVGTVEPDQSAAIRAQVGGTLKSVHFREGDHVKAGQLLFQIDPGTLLAEVESARANLARDQATLAEATAQQQRLAPLASKEYVTRAEYDQAVAAQKSASASAEANRAQLRAAEIQLGRTHLHAPISGRAGSLGTKQGNLVGANAAEPLVIINSIQPVLVAFSVTQQQFQEIRSRPREAMSVEIRRAMNGEVVAKGKLAFVDNAVDQATGTIRLKALIPNENEAIWPGELVSVRLILDMQADAVVVPESAVQPGQQGPFVYVVDKGRARMQNIAVARQVGQNVVIADGVKAGDQVIVSIPSKLRPGSAVKLADKDKDAPGDGKRQRKKKGGKNAGAPRS
jgi:multidrug efflux system membrane fusion protein